MHFCSFGFLENLNIRALHTRQSGWLFRPESSESTIQSFSCPIGQSMEVSIFSSFNHTFSSIYMHKEFPCSWNLTYPWFDIQYFIPNLLIASFLRSLSSTFVLWKVGGHAVEGKETFKYLQAIRKSPRFFSSLPWWQLREKSCHLVLSMASP